MRCNSDVMTVILAGGQGSRLAPLTCTRSKPAVPFGGQYRIIDFTLSNCLHSGLRRVLVLTQYKSQSLQEHLRDAWSIYSPELGEYITAVPAQLQTGNSWYQGTADAIYQNLNLLKRDGVKHVVVLSGDHIYRMDYSSMLETHRAANADVTVSCTEVSLADARSFGVLSADADQRIYRFEEKPDQPQPTAHDPHRALASMGIYVFSIDVLRELLESDAADPLSTHDIGRDLLPRIIHNHRVFCHRFGSSSDTGFESTYWKDVGTIDAYYRANMDLIDSTPPLNLYAKEWPIRHHYCAAPPGKIDRDILGRPGVVTDSLIGNGVVVSGGRVNRSILSSNVHVHSGATLDDCIVFDGVIINEGAEVRNCIIDKSVEIPAGERIGVDQSEDDRRFTVSDGGIVVVPRGYRFSPRGNQASTQHSVRPPEKHSAIAAPKVGRLVIAPS